jgi:hypothetical protein
MSLVDIIGSNNILIISFSGVILFYILFAVIDDSEDNKAKWVWVIYCFYGWVILLTIMLIVLVFRSQ